MSTVITTNRTAISGIAGAALVAAIAASIFAAAAPQLARDSAANASPIITGESSLIITTVQQNSGGIGND